jgi:hypothetical protein
MPGIFKLTSRLILPVDATMGGTKFNVQNKVSNAWVINTATNSVADISLVCDCRGRFERTGT